MNEELEALKIVAQILDKAGFLYMISGSLAANYYSVPRMTRDIDIVIELKSGNVGHFKQVFEKDFFVDEDMLENEIKKNGMFNLIHKEFLIKIDFILRKVSLFQDNTFKRRRKVTIDGVPMYLISPEDLILAKLLWSQDSHSELQLNDVRNLLKTVSPLDHDYLKDWIPQLQLEGIYKKVQS